MGAGPLRFHQPYLPPVTACVPDALGRMNETNKNEFESIQKAQTDIKDVIRLILHELKGMKKSRESVG